MKKFKNVKTGNIIRVQTDKAIALIEKSGRYAPVTEDKKGKKSEKADKAAE